MEQTLWILASEGLLDNYLKPKELIRFSLCNKEIHAAVQKDKCTKEVAFLVLIKTIASKILALLPEYAFPNADIAVCFHIFPDKIVKLYYDGCSSFKLVIRNEHQKVVFESHTNDGDFIKSDCAELCVILRKMLFLSKEAQTLLDACDHCTHVRNFVTLHLRPTDYYRYVIDDSDNKIIILDTEVYDMRTSFGDVMIRKEPYGRKIDTL